MSEQELLNALKCTINESMDGFRGGFETSMNELRTEFKETMDEFRGGFEASMNELRTELRTELKETVAPILTSIEELRAQVGHIELTLENETNRNIMVIAEGHSDLNRRLDEAIRAESKIELTEVRVNVLECEVIKLKDNVKLLQRPQAINI